MCNRCRSSAGLDALPDAQIVSGESHSSIRKIPDRTAAEAFVIWPVGSAGRAPLGCRPVPSSLRERSFTAAAFGYFYPQHRLWPIASVQQLGFDLRPVLPQENRKIVDGYTINTGFALVRFDSFPRQKQVVS